MKNFYFKKYKKKSGTLVPFSLIKNVPFKTKRIFIIYGNKNFIRGNHAHYKCSQFLIPIYGSMDIEYENLLIKKKEKLNYKKKKRFSVKTQNMVQNKV